MKNKNNEIIGLNKFIEKSLYNKNDGFYMSKNPFGKQGDFITSPNISIFFSEMLSIWILSIWEKLKKPKKINIIDLGGGNGEMSYNILQTLDNFPKFKNFFNIYIHEKSPLLKKKQKIRMKDKKVFWIDDLRNIKKGPCLFLANEFFDALPIKQYLRTDKIWKERKVKFSDKGDIKFFDIRTNIKLLEKKVGFKLSKNQDFLEISEDMINYLKIISKILKKQNGGLLIIDYGYYDKKMKNTLKSISKHKFNDVLSNFGKADITYDINYNFLEKVLKKNNLIINGRNNQKNFLTNLGILKRAEIITKKLPFSKKADIYYRVKTLIDNKSMGEEAKIASLFRCLLMRRCNITSNQKILILDPMLV